jgi:hypothetical protein
MCAGAFMKIHDPVFSFYDCFSREKHEKGLSP